MFSKTLTNIDEKINLLCESKTGIVESVDDKTQKTLLLDNEMLVIKKVEDSQGFLKHFVEYKGNLVYNSRSYDGKEFIQQTYRPGIWEKAIDDCFEKLKK